MPSQFADNIAGIPYSKLLALGKLEQAPDAVVYLSGSLVEGFGNSLSDIDVFIITETVISAEITTIKKDYTINIEFYNGRRVDFELYKPAFIHTLSKKLSEIKIGEEFVAERLSLHEELFIHRLKIGKPLHQQEEFYRYSELFNFQKFQDYLVQQAVHMTDGAIEDITGCVDDNDLNTAMLRCVQLVGLAADIFCYSNGCTNTLPKWRDKKLRLLKDAPQFDHVYDNFWNLSFPVVNRNDDGAKRAYIEECVIFANAVVESAQSTVNNDY